MNIMEVLFLIVGGLAVALGVILMLTTTNWAYIGGDIAGLGSAPICCVVIFRLTNKWRQRY